jgi:hypothetical protein
MSYSYINDASKEKCGIISNQMLSTFKFTKNLPYLSDKVIFPQGGENLKGCSTYEIKWELPADVKNVSISLNNKTTSAFEETLVRNYPNSGTFQWKVPSDQNFPQFDYVIRISGCHYSTTADMIVCGALEDPIVESGIFNIINQ